MSPAESDVRFPKRDLAAAGAILVLALLAYANSFQGAFVFDDVQSITLHPGIRGLRAFLEGGYRARPNRVFGYLTIALNHQLGGVDPTGYHLVNFCIHVASALLVYALVVLTFRTPRLRGSSLASTSRAIGFVAAALFVTHPLQTQAVTYVIQRLTSLATLLYLATVVLYARWRLQEGASRWSRILGYLPILVSALLAMKTKEIAFTLPLAVSLWELAFFEGRPAARLGRLLPLLATLVVIPLTLLLGGGPAQDLLSDVATVTRVQTGMSRIGYFQTELAVIATYLRLLVLPIGQNVDHDYPRAVSFLEPRVLWGIVVITALVAAAVALVRATSARGAGRRADPAARVVAFGILWFLLSLSVESSFIPIIDVMFEHRVYLPSVGFFVAVATGGGLLARRLRTARPERTFVIAGTAVAAVLAVATLSRNRVWADELSLWSDAVIKSPNKGRPHNNVAAALIDRGLALEAEPYARASVRLDPQNEEAFYNLGRIDLELGRYEESVALFREAIRMKPDYSDAYANLAGALIRLDRCDDAVRVLEGVAGLVRDNPPAHFNLGVAYSATARRADARRQVAILRALDPRLAAQLETFMAER